MRVCGVECSCFNVETSVGKGLSASGQQAAINVEAKTGKDEKEETR